MTNVNSAADVMLQNAIKHLTSGNVAKDVVLGRVRLLPTSEYKYCPYCVQRAKRGNKDNWQIGLNTLWNVTHYVILNIGNGKGKGFYENRFECDVCHKEIIEDDYLQCRQVRFNNRGEFDLSKLDSIDFRKFGNFNG